MVKLGTSTYTQDFSQARKIGGLRTQLGVSQKVIAQRIQEQKARQLKADFEAKQKKKVQEYEIKLAEAKRKEGEELAEQERIRDKWTLDSGERGSFQKWSSGASVVKPDSVGYKEWQDALIKEGIISRGAYITTSYSTYKNRQGKLKSNILQTKLLKMDEAQFKREAEEMKRYKIDGKPVIASTYFKKQLEAQETIGSSWQSQLVKAPKEYYIAGEDEHGKLQSMKSEKDVYDNYQKGVEAENRKIYTTKTTSYKDTKKLDRSFIYAGDKTFKGKIVDFMGGVGDYFGTDGGFSKTNAGKYLGASYGVMTYVPRKIADSKIGKKIFAEFDLPYQDMLGRTKPIGGSGKLDPRITNELKLGMNLFGGYAKEQYKISKEQNKEISAWFGNLAQTITKGKDADTLFGKTYENRTKTTPSKYNPAYRKPFSDNKIIGALKVDYGASKDSKFWGTESLVIKRRDATKDVKFPLIEYKDKKIVKPEFSETLKAYAWGMGKSHYKEFRQKPLELGLKVLAYASLTAGLRAGSSYASIKTAPIRYSKPVMGLKEVGTKLSTKTIDTLGFSTAHKLSMAQALKDVSLSKIAGAGILGLYGSGVYSRVSSQDTLSKRAETLGSITAKEITPMALGGMLYFKYTEPAVVKWVQDVRVKSMGLKELEKPIIAPEVRAGKTKYTYVGTKTTPKDILDPKLQETHLKAFGEKKYRLPNTKELVGNILQGKGRYYTGWHATTVPKINEVKAGTSEFKGLYVGGRLSAEFLRIEGKSISSYKGFGMDLFPKTDMPTAYAIYPEGGFKKASSLGLSTKKDFARFMEYDAKQGIAYIPSYKNEHEGIIAVPTKLKDLGAYYYTTWRGTKVPIVQALARTQGGMDAQAINQAISQASSSSIPRSMSGVSFSALSSSYGGVGSSALIPSIQLTPYVAKNLLSSRSKPSSRAGAISRIPLISSSSIASISRSTTPSLSASYPKASSSTSSLLSSSSSISSSISRASSSISSYVGSPIKTYTAPSSRVSSRRSTSFKLPALLPLPKSKRRKKKDKDFLWSTQIKTKKGYITAGTPLTKNMAIKRGAMITDKYLEASFKVVKTPRTTSMRDIGFSPSSNIFRNYKVRKGKRIPMNDKWIERQNKRLNTRSEVKQIRYAKLSKAKRDAIAKPKKRRKKR